MMIPLQRIYLMSDIGVLALVKYEYTDKSGWKVRPGLITGEYLNDYQVTFITKEVEKYKHENTSIIINNNDLSGGRHYYMRYGTYTLTLPSNKEYSVPQLKMLLNEIEMGTQLSITAEGWQDL